MKLPTLLALSLLCLPLLSQTAAASEPGPIERQYLIQVSYLGNLWCASQQERCDRVCSSGAPLSGPTCRSCRKVYEENCR